MWSRCRSGRDATPNREAGAGDPSAMLKRNCDLLPEGDVKNLPPR